MSKHTIVKLTEEQLEQKAQFIQEYMNANNASDGSAVDANANVDCKNIATLSGEIHKDINVQLKRYLVSKRIAEMYGEDLAKEYNRQIENHEIYVHDESHFCKPYCASITMYPFLLDGLKGLGGESKAPQHLASYCGNFINLVFALTSQIAGACLYKDQKLILDGKSTSIKDYVSQFVLDKSFETEGSVWEYADISGENHYVAEDGKFTKVNKVYRRKYSDKIYEIKTHRGLVVRVSKDHKFKQRFRGRDFETKAENLQIGDTVYSNTDFTYCVDKNSKDYKIGQIIGIFAGDGNICGTSARVSVAKGQEFIMSFLDENLSLIGVKTRGTRVEDRRGRGCYSYYVGGQQVGEIIRSYFKPGCYDTYTKDVDLSDKSLNWKLGFLDGLMVTDGSYSMAHSAQISLTNESLIKCVQEILSDLNIYKNYTSFQPKIPNRRKLYNLCVPLKVMKYLSLTIKKPTLSSVLKHKEKNSHIAPQDELYYVGTHAGASVKSCVIATNKNKKCKDFLMCDVIKEITTFENDDEYVYEIETETHWYNCGGLITHNCATVEFLNLFDYFARKDFGDNYLKTHQKIIDNCFQQVVYSLNQPASARDYQCPFWNISIFDKYYFESMFGEFRFPDCSAPNYESLAKLQEHFMAWFNKERSKAVLTFPVITAALLTEDGHPKDEKFTDMCSKQLSEGNSFFIYMSDNADALSSCCRLKNELTDNTFSYSLGAGGVATGSMNVITLNVNRFIQNCKGFDEEKLKEQIDKIHKYQRATKSYLKEYADASMTPIYKQHYISMDKQYLTIGINGLVEAAEYLGYKANNNPEYMSFVNSFLKVVYDKNREGRQIYQSMYNVEFVPAENLGVKNYNWDKKDGYVVNPKRNCYNSYMYAVEDEETTPIDKFILHGKDNLQYLDGGSALHLNLEEYPTQEGYKKLFNVAAKTGCNYWTTNIKVTCCEDCGYIDKHTLNKCPKCGSTNISYATRIIGYLKKINSFSSPRQQEADMRYYHKSNHI